MHHNGVGKAVRAVALGVGVLLGFYGYITKVASHTLMQPRDWTFLIGMTAVVSVAVGYYAALVLNAEQPTHLHDDLSCDLRSADDDDLTLFPETHAAITRIRAQFQEIAARTLLDRLTLTQCYHLLTPDQYTRVQQQRIKLQEEIRQDQARLSDAAFDAKWYPPAPAQSPDAPTIAADTPEQPR